MKPTYPSFYPLFRCTASQCSDNCCIGWEIDIDPETYSFYQTHPFDSPDLGNRFQTQISDDFPPHFLLDEKERCPFLNQKNLCDIYSTFGENHLCEICAEHPRFHEWFGDEKESGLGLCCEEAVRLLLSSCEPLSFCSKEIGEEADTVPFNPSVLSAVRNLRQKLFALLQNRNFPLYQRFQGVLTVAKELEEIYSSSPCPDESKLKELTPSAPFYFGVDTSPYLDVLREILHFLQTLEPIDPKWHSRLADLSQNLPTLLEQREAFIAACQDSFFEYEHLSVYFLYRYLLKSVRDDNAFAYLILSVFAPLFLFLLDLQSFTQQGNLSEQDIITNIKAFSKEIEYSEENLQALLEEFCCNPALSPELFIKLCSALLA